MQVSCLLRQSLQAVYAFRLRAVFSLLSVALGVGSLTVIVAATEGAYQKAYEIVGRFGPDSLLVIGGSDEASAIGQREKTLTLEDMRAVLDRFPTVYIGVPMSSQGDVPVSYRSRKYRTMVVGAGSDYSRAWTWPVVRGSDITDDHVKGARKVALIGAFLARELFGDEEPVGRTVIVKGIPVQVIGVLGERGMAPHGTNLDDRLVMPITTVMGKIKNERQYISAFRVRFLDQDRLSERTRELQSFLRERHGTPDGQPDDFRVISPTEIITFLVALTGSLVVFLGITGTISLVVAGFVLANLFLLSVSERTREIGIRRALGARRGDILRQFLAEALLLTTAGGLVGFLLAVPSSRLLALVADFPLHFSWRALAVGIALSTVVGLVFGLQPARKAARLTPLEALRS